MRKTVEGGVSNAQIVNIKFVGNSFIYLCKSHLLNSIIIDKVVCCM